jgi:plastocyanin
VQETRRTWLKGTSAAIVGVALAGCSGILDGNDSSSSGENDQSTAKETDTENTDDGQAMQAGATDIAVTSEWNAIRTRLRDPVILGHAEEFEAGASVVGDIFQRFEAASGEHNAHETLEETSEEHYEGFEDSLGTLRERLAAEDLDGAHDAMKSADKHLREAQAALTSDTTVAQLSMLVMGTHVEDAAMLVRVEDYDDAEHEFTKIGDKFDKKFYDTVAEADQTAADQFVDATDRAASNAASNPETAIAAAHEAFGASTQALHALADDTLAGAGHMAALQALGWDAAALAGLGGPSTEFAHAAALTIYRARVHDAAWLYERGQADAARQRVENVFAHFEGARAHEALEEASEDAYTRFEDDGLSALSTAIENDDAEGVASAVETINDALVEGIEALGSGAEPALLEAGYFKARIEDAHERYRLGEGATAAETARGLFETFEANEADFHETLEETDESLYETFEEEHLNGLITAFEEGNDGAVDEHVTGIRETLLSFETAAGSTAQVSAVESGYMAARVFDAGVLGVLGENERAGSLVQAAFQHFEAGAGGFHEALEEADHDRYESFEAALDDASSAAQEGGNVGEQSRAFSDEAVGAIYAVVDSGGGSFGGAATSIVQDTFAAFEEARVHEMLEEADESAYEGYESALNDYIGTLESGSGVGSAATAYADASIRAQFAVVGAVDEAPVGEDNAGESGGGSEETDLQGGPNIQDGVPDDADHVVNMQAVAFEPEELTIQQGDRVAWKHAAGEPHNVVAYEGEIPGNAEYWASGGFESEKAAREGWEEGKGAVQSGQSYVHTFEATGTHEYFCVPHEAAGMVGSVVVE